MYTPSTLYTQNSSAYPGEYHPLESKFKGLEEELSKPREGAIKPAANISETHKYYKVELAVPGLIREDFYVCVNEGVLSISALHNDARRLDDEVYQEHAFNFNCFCHELQLPDNIDTDFIAAEYKAGILEIWFLKTTKPSQKKASTIIVY